MNEPLSISLDPGAMSLQALILQADPVVQAVMAGLALASVVSWAIMLEKAIAIMALGREVARVEALTDQGTAPTDGLPVEIFAAAKPVLARRAASRLSLEERLERTMRRPARRAITSAQARVRILATIGASAPFVGLFGTVWGIMNSFTAIASQNDTSLATVAPGIAEALFATGLGLVAAIPAVIAYNQISGAIARLSERLSLAIGAIADRLATEQPEEGH